MFVFSKDKNELWKIFDRVQIQMFWEAPNRSTRIICESYVLVRQYNTFKLKSLKSWLCRTLCGKH